MLSLQPPRNAAALPRLRASLQLWMAPLLPGVPRMLATAVATSAALSSWKRMQMAWMTATGVRSACTCVQAPLRVCAAHICTSFSPL
jgi:hypothetical protein